MALMSGSGLSPLLLLLLTLLTRGVHCNSRLTTIPTPASAAGREAVLLGINDLDSASEASTVLPQTTERDSGDPTDDHTTPEAEVGTSAADVSVDVAGGRERGSNVTAPSGTTVNLASTTVSAGDDQRTTVFPVTTAVAAPTLLTPATTTAAPLTVADAPEGVPSEPKPVSTGTEALADVVSTTEESPSAGDASLGVGSEPATTPAPSDVPGVETTTATQVGRTVLMAAEEPATTATAAPDDEKLTGAPIYPESSSAEVPLHLNSLRPMYEPTSAPMTTLAPNSHDLGGVEIPVHLKLGAAGPDEALDKPSRARTGVDDISMLEKPSKPRKGVWLSPPAAGDGMADALAAGTTDDLEHDAVMGQREDVVTEQPSAAPSFFGGAASVASSTEVTGKQESEEAENPKELIAESKAGAVTEKSSGVNSSTIAGLVILAAFVIVVGFFVFRKAHESWYRRHYRKMDFLVDGMYNL